MTTRGSFDSWQAVAARSYLRVADIPEGETWCFEFVSPRNRIVVPYQSEEVVLLARIDNASGDDIPLAGDEPFRVAPTVDGLSFDEVMQRMEMLGPNEEGYVLRFASGMRAKAKGAQYKELHRIVTGTNAKSVWEMLRSGRGVDSLLDNTPDEFHKWLTSTRDSLQQEFDTIHATVQRTFCDVQCLRSRKDQALAMEGFPYRSAVFQMLDGKSPHDIIWKAVKPKADAYFGEAWPDP